MLLILLVLSFLALASIAPAPASTAVASTPATSILSTTLAAFQRPEYAGYIGYEIPAVPRGYAEREGCDGRSGTRLAR